jgi:CheY-like chemotaxis protein
VTSSEPYVLVVDDFEDGREMLSEYLRFHGLPVVEAPDGKTALQIARERTPAIVLMDLRMAGMDGFQTTEALRSDAASREVIVIAISAHVMKNAIETAFSVGCDGFISKPYEIEAVAKAVSDVLRRGHEGLAAHAALFHLVQPATIDATAAA